ncbi:peptidylprolyl isomerase [Aquicoccus sp. SCR17]|nr:peptidylprolyl isomerase [Carideicomes alvinocaridis]
MPYSAKTLSASLILSLALPGALAAQDTAAPAAGEETAAESQSAPAEVPAEGAATVVATVNGTDITLGHMILLKQTLPDQYRQLPDEVLFDGILQQIIQQALLAGSDAAEMTPRVRMAMENSERELMAGQAAYEIAQQAVTDEAVQAAYDAKYDGADLGKEYNASHILVKTEDEAKAIIEELENGAEFAEVAREKSTGPSASDGGKLPWFGEGDMVAPFEQAVMEMEPGTISDPVQTQFGWHVIQLNETRVKEAPALDEVRGQLQSEIQSEAVKARLDELQQSAEIERNEDEAIAPSLLSRTDLLEE